jgi:hypothetical protein
MDNRSTTSTTSISKSNQKIECPFCKEEFQNRFIFSHIKKNHIHDFVDHVFINTVEELETMIDNCMAVPLMWKVKNDFDELEDTEIHGCLACGQSTTTASGGSTHCNKDKCRAKHIAELKRLMPSIKRKQKAAQEDKASKNPKNWTEDQLIENITVSMRRYKYQGPSVVRLAQAYNNYARHAPDRFPPISIELAPLVMDKTDLQAEYMRWILLNSSLDENIIKMREVLWNDTKFDYEAWLPRSALHPDSVYIPMMCMHYPQFVAVYPQL